MITQESNNMLDIAQDADLDDLQQINLMEQGAVEINPQDFSLQNEESTFAPSSPSAAAPHILDNHIEQDGYQIIGQVGGDSSDDEPPRSKSSDDMNED